MSSQISFTLSLSGYFAGNSECRAYLEKRTVVSAKAAVGSDSLDLVGAVREGDRARMER